MLGALARTEGEREREASGFCGDDVLKVSRKLGFSNLTFAVAYRVGEKSFWRL